MLGGFGLQQVGQGINGIFSIINNAYDIYRANKKVGKASKDNTLNRHRAGIVFQNKENRDQLVREGLIPAYYSTSNIQADSALNAPEEESGSGGFQKDKGNNALLGGFGLQQVGQGINGIFSIINNAYDIYRANKKVGKASKDNTLNRHRAGIVFQNKENRDQLVREGLIPAYYSTSNIQFLIRKGVLPFGWNKDMAVEQGFGKDVYIHEMKIKTADKSKHFLEEEIRKRKLKNAVGEIENLKDRFKTRKMLEFYSQ